MLMYHLTQEAITKLFEISILLTLHHNFKCGFSQNFNVFLIKSTSEIMMINKSIKINIFKISVYLDSFCETFLSHQLKLLKNLIFSQIWVYFEPLLIGKLFDKIHIKNYYKGCNDFDLLQLDCKRLRPRPI